MRGRSVIFAFIFLFLVSFIAANDMTVHLKAEPALEVHASILKSAGEGFNSYQTLKRDMGYNETIAIDFSFEQKVSPVDILIIIKDFNGIKLFNKRFEDINFFDVYIDASDLDEELATISDNPFPESEDDTAAETTTEEPEEETNETADEEVIAEETEEETTEEETEVTEEETTDGTIITGQPVSNLKKAFSKIKNILYGDLI